MIAAAHLLLILIAWSSPFWLSWKIICIGIVLYYLQLWLVGDCVLTKWQFGSAKEKTTFHSHIFEKLGFRFNRQKVEFVADYIVPWIILGIALVWQVVLKKSF